jgi:hypothetical protein
MVYIFLSVGFARKDIQFMKLKVLRGLNELQRGTGETILMFNTILW